MGCPKSRPGHGKAEVLLTGGRGNQQGIYQRLQVKCSRTCFPVSLSAIARCFNMLSLSCTGSGFALRHAVTGLDAHSTYTYRLRASNNAGSSAWSPVVNVTTTGTYVEGVHAVLVNELILLFQLSLISVSNLVYMPPPNTHTYTYIHTHAHAHSQGNL